MIDLHAFPDRSTPAALDAQLLALARAPRLPRARLAELVNLCPQVLLAWSQSRMIAPSTVAVRADADAAPAWVLRLAIHRVVQAVAGLPRVDDDRWLAALESAATVAGLARYLNLDDPDGLAGRAMIAATATQMRRGIDALLCDMAEFAGEPPDLLADAHTGVILLAAARAQQAGATDSAQLLAALAHVPARRLATAYTEACTAVRQRCEAAGLLDHADDALAADNLALDLACVARIEAVALELAHIDTTAELRTAAAAALHSWFGERVAEFHPDPNRANVVLAGATASVMGICASPGGGRNLLAECVRQGHVLRASCEPQPLTVVDRQLLRRLNGDDALFVPLMTGDEPMGALVLATCAGGDEAASETLLVQWFAVTYAEWLGARRRVEARVQKIEADYLAANERRLREVVHEANNPLSIVHNYLHILGLRLNGEDAGREQLEMIGEEIRRTGEILQGLLQVPLQLDEHGVTEAAAPAYPTGHLDAAVRSVAALLQPVLGPRDVELDVHLAADMPPVAAPDERLRQLVTTLIRNSADDLQAGGVIEVHASADVIRDGVPSAELRVAAAAAAGQPDDIRAHATGMPASGSPGFEVVQQLVSALGGSVECRLPADGRRSVTVLLPLTA